MVSRRTTTWRTTGLVLIAYLGLTAPARADVITTSASFTSFGPVSLERFDTMGGTRVLTAVDITYTVDPLTIFIHGENFRSTPVTTTATLGGLVTFSGPPSANISFPVNGSETYTLGPSDGVAGSGPDYFEDAVEFTFFGTRVGVPSQFIGTGNFPLTVGGGGPVGFSPTINHPSSFPASIEGTVAVTYTFDSLVTVPEPSTIVLFGVGTLALCGYGWRRMKLAATCSLTVTNK